MQKGSIRLALSSRSRRVVALALMLSVALQSVIAQVNPENKSLSKTEQAATIEPSYLSISDGLVSPDVRSVIQDSYGLIWIGTNNGLQKYDGYRFETFKNIPGKANSLLDNVIWGLREDKDHNIWVANAKGISRYERKTNTFVNYDIAKILNLNTGAGQVFGLFIDSRNNLWAASFAAELLYYDSTKDTWKPALYDLPVESGNELHLSTALALAEDKDGGIWLGSGLYGLMYRAKGKTSFKPVSITQSNGVDFTDPLKRITCLFVDSANVVWVTSRQGIHKYYPNNNQLKTLQTYNYQENDNWNNWNSICRAPDGNIWIANNFRGLLKFEGISDRFQQVPIAKVVKLKDAGFTLTLTDFVVDKTGIFWIGTQTQGLMKYDPEKKPFSSYTNDPGNPQSIASNAIFGLTASSLHPNLLYIGTRGQGISIFDQRKQTFRQVKYKAVNDFYEGAVRSIGEDGDGNLWLGTWGDGLIGLDQNYREVKRYTYDPGSEKSISNNQVRVIKKDGKGNFWVGTNIGLNYFEPKTGQFNRIASRTAQAYPAALIQKVQQTENAVAKILDVTDNKNLTEPFEVPEAATYLIAMVGEGDVGSMADIGWLENAAGDSIWVPSDFYKTKYAGGALKNRVSIELLDLAKGSYKLRYKTDDSHAFGKWNADSANLTSLYGAVVMKVNSAAEKQAIQSLLAPAKNGLAISGSNISSIAVTDHYIWVGANPDGLNRIDPVNNTVKVYQVDPNSDNSIISNSIVDVAVDENGMVWITTDAGLNKLDPETGIFTRYTEQDGLPTNLLESVLPGTQGELWISSQNGLSQMVTNESLNKVTFINYTSEDGLQGNAFLSQVAARTPDAQFYFGGDQGLNAVSRVKANHFPPDLIISNLLISNKSVYDMGSDSPLEDDLLSSQNITLSFDQNNISFEFAALHYANPKKNQYAHMLKGYDKDWVYDNRNYASYTNLAPGEYEFVIRASNAYGIWNEAGKSLSITILPPWYATWWAYLLYAVAFVGLAYSLFRYQRKRIVNIARDRARAREMQHAKEIEKAYTELKATQTQLIHSEKMASLGELTAGIAHEIQNPLNFVNNFSELNSELIEELKSETAKGKSERDENLENELLNDIAQNLEKIAHHGRRADAIVKGMLQHSRSSSGEKEPTDINALVDEYLRLSYHGLRAKDKSFNAIMKTDFDQSLSANGTGNGKINIVSQDIGRVILNLLTNAFYVVNEKKQMHIEGYEPTVSVSTKKIGGKVEIRVADNGNGIPQQALDKIFQPFFTTKPSGQGTGLGLSLSYDIVKAHGGELKVVTKTGEGTEFVVQLPA